MNGWRRGNELVLLENGEEFFPRVVDAVRSARREVVLETFAWFEDAVGRELQQALVEAARRGVEARVVVDGFGTPGFSPGFLAALERAGVRVRSFDPRPTLFRVRTNLLCRLHRKIIVIDGERAFVGGINFSEEHLRSFGGQSKQDYAVEVAGPVVKDIHDYCRFGADLHPGPAWRRWRYWLRRFPRDWLDPQAGAQALLVIRDNNEHPTDIETMYRAGIRSARKRIIIANAYFFPGYRFVRDLTDAARRGVEVALIVQGNPDRPKTVGAASLLYDDLLAAGVKIYRYTERPLHAKVAVIDDDWATVGSSNLDPTSLGLNLEANLFIRDERFSARLRESLERLVAGSCLEITLDGRPKPHAPRRMLLALAYHLTRHVPTWGRRVLNREQRVEPMQPPRERAQPQADRPVRKELDDR